MKLAAFQVVCEEFCQSRQQLKITCIKVNLEVHPKDVCISGDVTLCNR